VTRRDVTVRSPGEQQRLARRLSAGVAAAAALFCVLASWATGEPGVGLIFGGLALLVAALAALSNWQRDRTRALRFNRELGGSLDRARSTLDVERIRRLRDDDGEAVALRELRRQLPQLSLDQLVELLRSL